MQPSTPSEWLDDFLDDVRVSRFEPVTVEQRGSRALRTSSSARAPAMAPQLNFGDCFSYALAKSLDVPLLYKGDDFAQTDIVSALA